MSPQLLQKFRELIPTMGLTQDMLVVLPKSGECQEGMGGTQGPSIRKLQGARGTTHAMLTPLCFPTDQCTEATR